MARYQVTATGFYTVGMKVEAESKEEAIEEFYTEGVPGICAQCSGWGQNWWLDCDPSEAEVDEDDPENVRLIEDD